jgi:uncharacterized membrane protein YgcG
MVNTNFNINDFMSNLGNHNETARADKFSVQFSIPSGLKQSGLIDLGTSMYDLSLQCEVSEIPGRDIAMVEYRKYGFIERIPHHNQYGSATFTVIVTGDMWEKIFFDSWMDYMVPAQTGLVNYAEDGDGNRNWEADITCFQYDNLGNTIYAVQLIDASPTSCSPLAQSWDNDSIHRLSLTFQFRKWTSVATTYNGTMAFGQPFPTATPSGTLSTAGVTTTQNPQTTQQAPAPTNATNNGTIPNSASKFVGGGGSFGGGGASGSF